MKYLTIFTLLLAIFVVNTKAQPPGPDTEPEPGTDPDPGIAPEPGRRCVGRPRNPSCIGERNVGRRGRDCRPRTLWHYGERSGECRELRYLGCGGNSNRHCTRAECERRCGRI